MAVPHTLDVLKLPVELLIALDHRPYHFLMQPVHYLVRMVHLLSVCAFFGGIGLLDLRLMGARAALPLRGLAEHVLPWLYGAFGVAMVTGTALFLYDPVHVGSHVYFTMKLLLILAGAVNAAVFHGVGYTAALASGAGMPRHARLAGAMSLALWTAVIVCACLNVEPPPKLLLR